MHGHVARNVAAHCKRRWIGTRQTDTALCAKEEKGSPFYSAGVGSMPLELPGGTEGENVERERQRPA